MNSSDFDRRFDQGGSVLAELDLNAARRSLLQQTRVDLDLPLNKLEGQDRTDNRLT